MTIRNLAALAALTFLAFPLAAHAQSGGAAAGATTGAVGGAIVGGPVGAVVGGVGGQSLAVWPMNNGHAFGST